MKPFQTHTLMNTTVLNLIFSSPKIIIENELDAYTTTSFIADCGGLLGLFIGFNFLMIWDFAVFIFNRMILWKTK